MICYKWGIVLRDMCKNVDEYKEIRKNNNYDIIFYKIVVVEIMIFKFVDNVSFIYNVS